jgi:hypothetical protein
VVSSSSSSCVQPVQAPSHQRPEPPSRQPRDRPRQAVDGTPFGRYRLVELLAGFFTTAVSMVWDYSYSCHE